MKKYIIFALIISPIFVFGATQVIKEYKQWDFIASIQTPTGQPAYVYKIDDPYDPNIKCYVLTNSFSLNERSNGANFGISCVKVK